MSLRPVMPLISDQVCTAPMYWLRLPLNFTGVPGEQVLGFTNPVDFNLHVRGAWTEILNYNLRLTAAGSGNNFSQNPVPVQLIAGDDGAVDNMLEWQRPYILPARETLRADLVNNAAGNNGQYNLIFLCQRPELARTVAVPLNSRVFWLQQNINFVNAGDRATFTTEPLEFPVVIVGAFTDSPVLDVMARFFESDMMQAWSDTELPLSAFCGNGGNSRRIMFYPGGYLLNAQSKIRGEYTNGATPALSFTVGFLALTLG
jgi:hypothetical protein